MNRYANSLIARGYSREYAENAAADRADRARDDAIDRELEAAARLRDAAPDMLACLQWFMAQMRDDGAIDMCKLIDEMERRASAAIAKATNQ